MKFVAKNYIALFVYDDEGMYCGLCEFVGDCWVYHSRRGAEPPLYAFGHTPEEAYDNWRNRCQKKPSSTKC